MRRGFAALVFLLLAPSARADFAAGVAAYDRGDYEAAYQEWLPLARNDDAAAQRNLGHLHRAGLGVPQDFAEAARWYRRAAELGLAGAQVNLGSMYLQGQGVNEDPVEAALWFERAARQGHPIAQYNLGAMHLKGLGVPLSEPRALGWLNLAARQGHQPALDLLSEIVRRPPDQPVAAAPEPRDESAPKRPEAPAAGAQPASAALTSSSEPPDESAPTEPEGAAPDARQASAAATPPPSETPPEPARKAEASSDISLGDVGGFFSRTFGALFDPEPLATAPAEPTDERAAQLAAAVVALHAGNFGVARERLEPLAEAGDAEARRQLGLLHARGDYDGADLALAWAWLDLAARQGRGDAAEARRQIEPRLTSAQKAAAESFVAVRAGR